MKSLVSKDLDDETRILPRFPFAWAIVQLLSGRTCTTVRNEIICRFKRGGLMTNNDALSSLFRDFDNGRLSRRQLLQALGLAAVASPIAAFGQGSCSAPEAKGTPRCNTTPMPAPFEPTGWKTVLLDFFTMQVKDVEKEAAYYNALMGWRVRSNDGDKIVLDIGNIGGVVIRGGYVAPPPPAAPPAGIENAARGGRGGGRGPGGEGGEGRGRGDRGGGNRIPLDCSWDGFCFGIAPWDTKKVETELKKRGLNPVADHNPKENFFSFHVKDPDGFDLQWSNGNKSNRRKTPATGKVDAPAPFEPTGWQTIYLDHISFEVTSYKETAAFYQALIGWNPTA